MRCNELAAITKPITINLLIGLSDFSSHPIIRKERILYYNQEIVRDMTLGSWNWGTYLNLNILAVWFWMNNCISVKDANKLDLPSVTANITNAFDCVSLRKLFWDMELNVDKIVCLSVPIGERSGIGEINCVISDLSPGFWLKCTEFNQQRESITENC